MKNFKGVVTGVIFIICVIAFINVNKIESKAATVEKRTSSYKLNVKHDFSIMSQNLRYQKETDSAQNAIEKRYNRLTLQMNKYDTDIKCFQEFNSTWKKLISQKLTTKDYYFVQTPYVRTKLSNAIYVKKSKFTLIDSGYFVVTATSSDTSDRSRYASWMKLQHKKTGKVVTIMNTHLTPHCATRQIVGSKRIMNSDVIKNSDRYIICGDFNIRRMVHTKAYSVLTSNKTKDMCKAAKTEGIRGALGGTFHKWGKISVDSRTRIDYFFGSSNLKSSMYTLLNDTYNGQYVSDHYGIMNYVSFK